jgi:hypothetical protein
MKSFLLFLILAGSVCAEPVTVKKLHEGAKHMVLEGVSSSASVDAALALKLPITDGTAVNLSTDTLQFDVANTNLAAEGQIAFVDEQGGLVIGMPGGGQLTIGAEGQIRVYNDTGSTLSNGTLVSIEGRQGNFPKAVLCSATNVTECGIIGMVTDEAGIADAHFGQVTVWGLVRDVPGLTSYSAGDILYLSETPGEFTSTAPSYPAEPFMVGKVAVVTGNTGDIELRLDGWKTWLMLDGQYVSKSSIVQTTGTNTTEVMSQAAVTTNLALKAGTTNAVLNWTAVSNETTYVYTEFYDATNNVKRFTRTP